MGADYKTDEIMYLSNSPRARARFVETKAMAKGFLVAKRSYKRPDFARMILDLRSLKWTHEKIAFVLDGVSCPSVISAWVTGSTPNFINGDQFIALWRDQTGIERYPRVGEDDYHYEIKTK